LRTWTPSRPAKDPRVPEKVVHHVARSFAFACWRLPPAVGTATTPTRCVAIRCSSWLSIVCTRAKICVRNQRSHAWKTCLIRGRCCASAGLWSKVLRLFRAVPNRIVLDIDDTFDRLHSSQRLRLFNAYHNDYGFRVVFDGELCQCAVAAGQATERGGGSGFVRRLVGAIRANWPKIDILLRADSHYAATEVLDWCWAGQVRLDLRSGPQCSSPPPGRHWRKAGPNSSSCCRPAQAAPLHPVLRCRRELGPARAHHRPRRSGAPRGTDTGRPREALLRAAPLPRSQAENHIKGWKEPPRSRPHFLPCGRG